VTYLLAGICVLWLGVSTWIAGALVAATELDSRAQAAADAAALAAMAEALPGESGRMHPEALRYARLNDARLIECLCVTGATAVQVTVEVDGARASARAVFEPELLKPLAGAAETASATT